MPFAAYFYFCRTIQVLKIKVRNNGACLKGVNAVNLKIEACIVIGNETYHLALDRDDFLILPPKCKNPMPTDTFHERVFKAMELSPETIRDYPNVNLNMLLSAPQIFRVRKTFKIT